MKRVLALAALTAALAGCQSMQRDIFGQPTTTSRPATISSTPAAPPSGYVYQPAPAQPTFNQPVYTAPTTYTQPAPQPDRLPDRAADGGQRTLLDADRAFSDLVIQRGLTAAVSALADPEGTMLASTNTTGSMNLIPEKATLSSSQDFGQTTGRFVQVLPNKAAVQGRYLTVWRKTGGTWRVLSFASMVGLPPKPAPAAPARRR